jgi:hypothetical protein
MAIMTLCLLVCKPPINPSSHRVQNGRFEQSSVLTQLGRLTSTDKMQLDKLLKNIIGNFDSSSLH